MRSDRTDKRRCFKVQQQTVTDIFIIVNKLIACQFPVPYALSDSVVIGIHKILLPELLFIICQLLFIYYHQSHLPLIKKTKNRCLFSDTCFVTLKIYMKDHFSAVFFFAFIIKIRVCTHSFDCSINFSRC